MVLDIEQLNAYELVEKKELPEVKGIGYILSHKKTKARVMLVLNDDDNKVFTIGFRTPPADDMGIPHIMEHSVLCGSKKFPAKDPFVELCKGSLNTFLNAMTYSDKTVYPVASLNKKDFHNLMHVYLDAVFYPNIYTREEILMQEGWHYEVDENTGELKYNGVVFNEMKGVYSSAEQQLFRIIEKSLHGHTAYSYESGGDPVYITDLDRQTFLDFHGRYYHPSNSYIYLYGDMDAVSELQFIDEEYLSNYDYLEIDSELTDEPEFKEAVNVKAEYPLADAEDEKDNTYLAYNVTVGKSTDKKLCTAFTIIEYALLDAPGAPLKEALIDAGIGMDVFSSFDDGIKQPSFSVVAKNANEEDKDRFIKTINDTLQSIVDNGINKKSFLAAINHFEFKHKEANFRRFPKGLMLGLNAFSFWLYDDSKALEAFSYNDIYEELKSDVDNGFFEELIRRYILENNNKSYVVLAPKKGLGKKIEEAERQKLARYKETLSDADIEAIKKRSDELKLYQSEPSTKEELETIPLLEISDIDKKARTINNQFYEIELVKIVGHDIFTNGITYINLDFDISDIDYDKYPYAALLTEIFKYVDTKNYSYNELANEINLHTGGIGFDIIVSNTKEQNVKVSFTVNAKMLDDKIDAAMELINEILFTSDIENKKRLKEIISEVRVNLKNDLVAAGHTTAAGRVVSYISPIGVVKELTEGVDYYKFLEKYDKGFDSLYDELRESLKGVLGEMLRRGGLTVSYTSDKNPEKMLTNSITKLSKLLSTRAVFEDTRIIQPKLLNEGFKTASQVQYVATAGNFVDKGLPYRGELSVLQSIFSYDYLWLNVRVKGGAYGCMCSFNRSGNSYFTSYRDPNLMETYEIYKRAPEYVRSFEADERDMTKYIIGAIAKLDSPLTPSSYGAFSYGAYVMGITDEDLQRERDEVLGATVSDIRALAPYVEAAVSGSAICAIGNETKLDAAKESFKTVDFVF